MKNPYLYSDSNKRYLTFDYYLKHRYNSKVFKVALNAGFTCPNRDGKKGYNGCIYCSKNGSGEYAGNIEDNLIVQFKKGKEMMLKKWPNGKAIAYFQAYTNTYGTVEYLHKVYDQFVDMDDCLAITIATRPDCLEPEILDFLEDLSHKKELFIELGLQTCHDETGKMINRGYDYDVFANAVRELSLRNIKVVVHLINGLPDETKEMMIETVKKVSLLPIFGIKFHCLNILRNTTLADIYKDINLHILSKEKYLDVVAEQLSYLPENVVVERINTDSMRKDLIAPTFNNKKVSVSNDLDKLMIKKDLWQGKNARKYTNYLLLTHNLLLNCGKFENAIDCTLGNGYDSLFLTHHFKNVISFDVQDLAIKRSTQKLQYYKDVKLVKDSFINASKYIENEIDAAVYNLGFLPGSNHNIVTNGNDVIESLKGLLPKLSKDGVCVIVSYLIHNNSEEYNIINEYLNSLTDYKIYQTRFDQVVVIDIKKK